MKAIPMFLIAGLLAVAGCGSDDDEPDRGAQQSATATIDKDAASERQAEEAAGSKGEGTKVIVADSSFGEMLYGSDRQAIYIFERDTRGKSVCYGECAKAWPPVFTDGEPITGKGVKASLLGTVKRRDGRLQVSYAGKPLYYYANEEPGEVRCHNVNLNGGLWWVVGPNGKRRP